MAKFRVIYWLVEFLQSQIDFIFDWDEGNMVKSQEKHGVTIQMVGKANTNEVIFICFTIREGKIRPISARFANKKERSIYEEIC